MSAAEPLCQKCGTLIRSGWRCAEEAEAERAAAAARLVREAFTAHADSQNPADLLGGVSKADLSRAASEFFGCARSLEAEAKRHERPEGPRLLSSLAARYRRVAALLDRLANPAEAARADDIRSLNDLAQELGLTAEGA